MKQAPEYVVSRNDPHPALVAEVDSWSSEPYDPHKFMCSECGFTILQCRCMEPWAVVIERRTIEPEETTMKVGEAFPSKFLKAEDLGGKRVQVKVKYYEMEKIGDDDKKPVLYFVGKDKGLVLNKTNALTIADITGEDDMDNWAGHVIVLYPDRTTFAGKPVKCIRVTEPASARVEPDPVDDLPPHVEPDGDDQSPF